MFRVIIKKNFYRKYNNKVIQIWNTIILYYIHLMTLYLARYYKNQKKSNGILNFCIYSGYIRTVKQNHTKTKWGSLVPIQIANSHQFGNFSTEDDIRLIPYLHLPLYYYPFSHQSYNNENIHRILLPTIFRWSCDYCKKQFRRNNFRVHKKLHYIVDK